MNAFIGISQTDPADLPPKHPYLFQLLEEQMKAEGDSILSARQIEEEVCQTYILHLHISFFAVYINMFHITCCRWTAVSVALPIFLHAYMILEISIWISYVTSNVNSVFCCYKITRSKACRKVRICNKVIKWQLIWEPLKM